MPVDYKSAGISILLSYYISIYLLLGPIVDDDIHAYLAMGVPCGAKLTAVMDWYAFVIGCFTYLHYCAVVIREQEWTSLMNICFLISHFYPSLMPVSILQVAKRVNLKVL